jgi:hypothetical protein
MCCSAFTDEPETKSKRPGRSGWGKTELMGGLCFARDDEVGRVRRDVEA